MRELSAKKTGILWERKCEEREGITFMEIQCVLKFLQNWFQSYFLKHPAKEKSLLREIFSTSFYWHTSNVVLYEPSCSLTYFGKLSFLAEKIWTGAAAQKPKILVLSDFTGFFCLISRLQFWLLFSISYWISDCQGDIFYLQAFLWKLWSLVNKKWDTCFTFLLPFKSNHTPASLPLPTKKSNIYFGKDLWNLKFRREKAV